MASIVVIAEVLSIAVEEQITKDGPGGLTGVDASKLQPVSGFSVNKLIWLAGLMVVDCCRIRILIPNPSTSFGGMASSVVL